ncbi:hypothetical protein CBR_g53606 [Chara braunii]|uniref:DUF659 domain-containing protein n=1 Tax=Chara braunii TaxID=69332 RepID=A0A388MB04_CHABU|nr:hypothetical protein CBR_g53606 [Chara braunii]|eukprot:GBG91754.1 hypothetical protein CBR_g53606 [Chara braunii]
MAPKKGRGDQPFVPVSKDKQREAELKFCGFKWVMKGQTMPNSNGNFLMECKLCGQGFQGSQTKAAQHFTIKNNCAKISVEQMAEIWNKTKYGFDPSHARKIVDFLKSRGLRDNRSGSGRELAGNEEFEDSEEERRAVEGGDHDGESDAEDMERHRVVADMVAAIHRDIEATGATILTDGRKSITSDQIVNFLAACPTGAYLFRTVERDGAVQETAEAVEERWKDVFDKFGVDKDGRDGSLGKREDTIIRARAVVRFIREHGAALSLYRRFSAAHPSSASAAAGGSSFAPPSSQRRGRELVYPVQTKFATHCLMLERLLDRCRALEALVMRDDWLRTAWRRSIFLQARWVRHQVQYAPFWEHVEDIVVLMTPVMQLLRRLDRGGRVMTRMWSCGFVMVDRVARASLNRTSKDELHIVVQACQARLAEFHSREGDWTYGGAEGDRDAAACKGEKETSQGAEEETEDAIPPPRDEGVRPADRVTEAQRDRQIQRGRKDRLSKAPPSVATYFGRRATVLMAHELESVYDPEPDPMAHDAMEAEPWSDPDDLAVESEPRRSDDDDDDTPLIQIPRPRTRASTAAAAPSPAARPPSTDQPMSAPAEATLPHTAGRIAGTGDHAEHNAPPGRSMAAHILREDVRAATTQRPSQAPVVWESGTDDLEMPYGQGRRVSVYDLLHLQGGVEAVPQGEIHALDTTHAPAGGTGRGDGVLGVVPQRRRKDIVDDDDA